MFFVYSLVVELDKNSPQYQIFVEAGNVFANSGKEAESMVLKEANEKYKQFNHLTFVVHLSAIQDNLIIRAYNEITDEQDVLLHDTKSIVDQLVLYPTLNPRKMFVYKTIKIAFVKGEYIVKHGKKTYQSSDALRIRHLIENIMGVENA